MESNLNKSIRTRPLLRCAAVVLAMLGVAAHCEAKNNCPWINEATASGLLGGEGVGDFTDASAGQPAVCTIAQTSAGLTRALRITVLATPNTHARVQAAVQACGKTPTPLQAIGNEAFLCDFDSRNGALSATVIGRVRDQFFTITLSTTLKDDLLLTRMTMKDKIYTASEQVAGNLF